MATINQLPLLIDPQAGDQVPVWSAVNGDTRRSPFSAFAEAVADFIAENTPIGYCTMTGNVAATTITQINTPVKAVGVTTIQSVSAFFTDGSNRLTYVGNKTRKFKGSAVLSLSSNNNNTIGIFFAKNGSVIAHSESVATTSGNGQAENVVAFVVTELAPNDYLELWVENTTGVHNITVRDLAIVVEALN